jgi:hypothetical protein
VTVDGKRGDVFVDTSLWGPIVLGLITLANAVLTMWNNRKIAAVHTEMNGMKAAAIKAAELAGFSRGAGTSPPPPPDPPGASA